MLFILLCILPSSFLSILQLFSLSSVSFEILQNMPTKKKKNKKKMAPQLNKNLVFFSIIINQSSVKLKSNKNV